MPFDGTSEPARALVIGDTPDLATLEVVLRDRSLWPSNEDGTPFEWDYLDCRQCALGLAAKLWERCSGDSKEIAEALQMPLHKVRRIFRQLPQVLLGDAYFWLSYTEQIAAYRQITPEHVADAIAAYLASRAGGGGG